MTALANRLTEALGIRHPIISAPMAYAAGGALAAEVRAAGTVLICQCQNLTHVRAALDAEADVVVAQGSEAGGHGARRGTFTLVPEVADMLARDSPATMLVAAGGVADRRGLAAALALGADGVLVGTRLCA